jgi:hypothetical protein
MRDPTVCRGCGKNLREGSDHEADCLAAKLDSMDRYNGNLIDTNRALAAERDEALGKLNAIRKVIGMPMTDADGLGARRGALIGTTAQPKRVDPPGEIVKERCDNTPCVLDAGHEGMCSSFRPTGK